MTHLTAMKKKRSSKKGPLQIGILGCMAERLKTKLLEKEQLVDVGELTNSNFFPHFFSYNSLTVAGPDSYKDLPRLLALTRNGQSAVNVLLSLDETYADVMPVRLNEDSVTAFVYVFNHFVKKKFAYFNLLLTSEQLQEAVTICARTALFHLPEAGKDLDQ